MQILILILDWKGKYNACTKVYCEKVPPVNDTVMLVVWYWGSGGPFSLIEWVEYGWEIVSKKQTKKNRIESRPCKVTYSALHNYWHSTGKILVSKWSACLFRVEMIDSYSKCGNIYFQITHLMGAEVSPSSHHCFGGLMYMHHSSQLKPWPEFS